MYLKKLRGGQLALCWVGLIVTALLQVAAAQTPTPEVIPGTYFGMTVGNFYNVKPTLTYGTTRTSDSYPYLDWSDINYKEGVYNFNTLDIYVAMMEERNADIIYTLNRTPQWASSQPNNTNSTYGPGECAPPTSMTYYDDYVTALVTRYKGKIKFYELWNEAQSSPMYCGTVQQMVTLAQHAHQIIKAIDPNAQLMSPGVTGGAGPGWLDSFLAAGGGNYIDGIAFHGYWNQYAEYGVQVVASYRTVMAKYGAVAKLPMYDTEASWGGMGITGIPSSFAQVGYVAKTYLLQWCMGVSRFVWYMFDSGSGSVWGDMRTSTGAESPAAFAYKETYRWMVGAWITTPCGWTSANIYSCGLGRSGGYSALAVWIPNSTATYTVPSVYKQYEDLAGGIHAITGKTVTISDQPILLETGNIP